MVFCDGDYWHGHNWALRGLRDLDEELAGYSEFWVKKIRRNIQRDEEVNGQLAKLDWKIVRVWESEIKSDLERCVNRIYETYIKALE